MAITVGQAAPDFKLFNTEKKEISLSDYKGKNLVILFFPLAFTGVCTAELCNIRDNYNVYTSLNAEVVGVSIDSLFSLERFKKEQSYNFDLLSDFNKETARTYGAIYEDWILGMKGVAKRAAFVIDENGVVTYAEVLESAGDLPDFGKIEQAVG